MTNKSFITLPWKFEREAPRFESNAIKSPESLARYVLKNHTKKGNVIFDPFTGLGTNMFIAEEMGRIPFGIEAEEQKQQWVAGQLKNWTHLIHDDAANLEKYNFPKIDLVVTSPPYMERHTKYNPLYAGNPKFAGYDKYLKRMEFIFSKLGNIMKKNAPLIVQLDNIQNGKNFTPLIHDIANTINKNFIQTGETIIKWDNPKPDYPFTTLLYFKKK